MTDTLSAAALDTVTTMAFGRKVLMVGTNYGQDVLALAQAAQVVAAFTLPRGENIAEEISKTSHLRQALIERRLAGNIVLHSVPWDQGLEMYLVDEFDLAVVNPGALGEDHPGELISHVIQFTESLIVIEPSGGTLWEETTTAVADWGMICSGDGAIIVARPMPTEPAVRRD